MAVRSRPVDGDQRGSRGGSATPSTRPVDSILAPPAALHGHEKPLGMGNRRRLSTVQRWPQVVRMCAHSGVGGTSPLRPKPLRTECRATRPGGRVRRCPPIARSSRPAPFLAKTRYVEGGRRERLACTLRVPWRLMVTRGCSRRHPESGAAGPASRGRVRTQATGPRAGRSSSSASTGAGSLYETRCRTSVPVPSPFSSSVPSPRTDRNWPDPPVIASSLCGGGALTKAKVSVPRPSMRMTPVQFDRPVASTRTQLPTSSPTVVPPCDSWSWKTMTSAAEGPGCPRSV
jgi:hypothetical protein